MAPDVALLTGVLALVALVAAKLPFKVLLRRDWRLDVALGTLAGTLRGINMALPSLQGLLEPAGIATAGTAVAMLVFGPVAGLVSMAIVAVVYAMVHTGEAFADRAAAWQAPKAWRSQKPLAPVPLPVSAPALLGTAQYLPDVQPPGGH